MQDAFRCGRTQVLRVGLVLASLILLPAGPASAYDANSTLSATDCLVNYLEPDAIPPGEPGAFARGAAPHRIVLQFLILRPGNGVGGYDTLELLPELMRDLNHGFRNTPFVFVAKPDIIYIDSDTHYTLEVVQDALDLFAEYETPGVLNIFFSDIPLFTQFQARAYTAPANPRGHIFADVVGLPYSLPYAPHEMGHLLGLYHPYETKFGAECVGRFFCTSLGDLICDTPASPAVHSGNTTATGVYFGSEPEPCTQTPTYAPRTDLYMEAGWFPGSAGYNYRNAFSDGQVDRMLNTLMTVSSDLIGPERPDVVVDCDGDGADDVDEILSGAEADINQDLVPDDCQVFANPGDLLVSGMTNDLTNRPRFFDGTTGAYRGDLWSGVSYAHQLRMGPDGLVYMPSLKVILRLDPATGRFVDNFIDGGAQGAGTFVDLLFDPAGDLLVLDNTSRRIRRYSGVDGSFLGDFADLSSTGITSLKYMEYGPDGNLYAVATGSMGHTVQGIDPGGTSLGSLITPGAGGLSGGSGLVFHTDGKLYVSNSGANTIIRYHANGDLDRVFVTAAGNGGLSNPHSLRFGPDGNLYVASRGTNSVKSYDGTTGDYLGDFVSAGAGGVPGSGGLLSPAGLLFVGSNAVSVGESTRAPAGFRLSTGTPNPFTESVAIRFELPRAMPVQVNVYDIRGRAIRTIENGRVRSAGSHRVEWDGRSDGGEPVPPGVYFYELRAGGFRQAERVVRMR